MKIIKYLGTSIIVLTLLLLGVYIVISSSNSTSYASDDVEKYSQLALNTNKTIKGIYNDEEIAANVTINSISIEDKIEAPLPQYTNVVKYENNLGKKYLKIDLTMNNIGSIELNSLELDGDGSTLCKPNIILNNEEKNYNSTTVLQLKKEGVLNRLTTIVSIKPNQTENIWLITEIDKQTTLDNYDINICFGDNLIKIKK
ncbi:MAG: hypothetical protein PHQ64_01740 [Bacilli bacterium]|nr:hypothetical protein [Bacilli bacterium]